MKEVGKWAIYFIIFLLISGFIWYFFIPAKVSSSVSNHIKNAISNIINPIRIQINSVECPKEILPDKVILWDAYEGLDGNSYSPVYNFIEQQWKDGTLFDIENIEEEGIVQIEPHCSRGTKEGENINYFYCKIIPYNPINTFADERGIIKTKNLQNYYIKLTLKPSEPTEEKRERLGMSINIYRNYSIISAICIKQ